MNASAGFYLDAPLWYLGRDLARGTTEGPGGAVLDVLAVRVDGARAALLFRSEAAARAHLPGLPEGYRARPVAADDWRAKEELLRAALVAEAEAIFLDTEPGGLEPAETRPTRKALAYVLSQKREAACL